MYTRSCMYLWRSEVKFKFLLISSLLLCILLLFYLSVLQVCIYVHQGTTCVPHVCGGQRRQWFPETGVTDGCELLCRYWELNPGPLQEQVLLTAESSLLPLHVYSSVCYNP